MTAPDLFALARQDDDEAMAEARELAAIEFEPWDNVAGLLEDFSQPIYGKMTAEIGFWLRLAAVTLGKTKPELVKAARELCADYDDDDEDHPLFAMFERVHSRSG